MSLLRPIFRPVPLLGLATAGVILASFSRSGTRSISSAIKVNMVQDWPVKKYTQRHTTWPYTEQDFKRSDPTPDTGFYSDSRFVTHIDDRAISSLREYYAVLPHKGKILDFCSSWVSHYPTTIEQDAKDGAVEVTGMGMNKAELDANDILKHRFVVDLNEQPDIADHLSKAGVVSPVDKLDAATCVVSIDYLTKPTEVLKSLRTIMKPGGQVHLTISNRCFPTKAVGRWLKISEDERLMMVGDYLFFAGWSDIEIVELSDGIVHDDQQQRSPQTSLQNLMSMIGMNSRDPLWVVRAVNR